MVFLESPCTVGFSYCTGANSTKADDNSTAADNLQAVLSFFGKYPQYKENDFYVAGENYGGIYVPYLAYWIHNHNLDPNTLPDGKINLKGWIVGNGLTNWDYDAHMANIDWLYSHAMYSPPVRAKVEANCHSSNITDHQCPYFAENVESPLYTNTKINMYDLNGFCYSGTSKSYDPFPAFHKRVQRLSEENGQEVDEILTESLSCVDSSGVDNYFNNQTIRNELHIPSSLDKIVWSECSEQLDYDEEGSVGSYWIYKELIPLEQYKILVFSGDTDSVVSTLGTQRWLDRLRVEMQGQFYMKSFWTPWLVPGEVLYNPQIGGFATVYNGLTFVTVRGAGHQASQSKPFETFVMIHYFLDDTPFDTYPMVA